MKESDTILVDRTELIRLLIRFEGRVPFPTMAKHLSREQKMENLRINNDTELIRDFKMKLGIKS